jgi:hypothetical protein
LKSDSAAAQAIPLRRGVTALTYRKRPTWLIWKRSRSKLRLKSDTTKH